MVDDLTLRHGTVGRFPHDHRTCLPPALSHLHPCAVSVSRVLTDRDVADRHVVRWSLALRKLGSPGSSGALWCGRKARSLADTLIGAEPRSRQLGWLTPELCSTDDAGHPRPLALDSRCRPRLVSGSTVQRTEHHPRFALSEAVRLHVDIGRARTAGDLHAITIAGCGTTADAAFGLGRSSVSIDLDVRNVDLARDRLGMVPLDVHDHRVAT